MWKITLGACLWLLLLLENKKSKRNMKIRVGAGISVNFLPLHPDFISYFMTLRNLFNLSELQFLQL
jgi:hypothetical protein